MQIASTEMAVQHTVWWNTAPRAQEPRDIRVPLCVLEGQA